MLGLLLAGLGLTLLVARGRSYQVDEIEHVHVAYHLQSGRVLYRDFWEGHHPLLYTLLTPWVDPEKPEESFLRSRLVMAGVLAATVAASALVALCLAGPWAAGTTATLMVIHSTFVERGIEVRPDCVLACLTMLALAVDASWPWSWSKRLVQGLLVGLGLVATQKGVFLAIGFGLFWLWTGWRRRRWSDVLAPLAGGAVPLAAMLMLFWGWGILDEYLRYCVVDAGAHATRVTAEPAAFGPLPFLMQEGRRNPVFVVGALFGLVFWTSRAVGRSSTRRGLPILAAVVGWAALASLWLNPFPFPYLHVTVIPPLACLAGAGLVQWLHFRSRRLMPALLAALLVLAASTSAPRLVEKAVQSNLRQIELLGLISAVTDPDDTVFDLVGLYFRPDAYPVFTMTGVMMNRYRNGVFPRMIPALIENEAVAAMLNYRTRWLPEQEGRFLAEHFVHYHDNLFIQGTVVELGPNESRTFRVLKTKSFQFEGQGELLVDGVPFRKGVLERGVKELGSGAQAIKGRLVLGVPAPPRPESPKPLYVNFD
jgi:hypothetical protein